MKRTGAILSFILTLSSFQVKAQQNLINNGGFEEGLNGWGAGNAKISSFIQNSGKSSLALVAYVPGKWEGIDQKVKLPKNTKALALSGAYKLDEVEQGKNAWNVAVVIIEFTKVDQKIGESIVLIEKKGSIEWTNFRKLIRVPDDATGFRLMVALSEASGTFFVDDLSAKAMSLTDFEKESANTENIPSN